MGCPDHQCCTYVNNPLLPRPPPPSPPRIPPLIIDHCPGSTLTYSRTTVEDHVGVVSSLITVLVVPWQEHLRVSVLLRSPGEFVDVMEVRDSAQFCAILRNSAQLADARRRPATGARRELCARSSRWEAFLRISFDLLDEPIEVPKRLPLRGAQAFARPWRSSSFSCQSSGPTRRRRRRRGT